MTPSLVHVAGIDPFRALSRDINEVRDMAALAD
jgi:hypothetical protein